MTVVSKIFSYFLQKGETSLKGNFCAQENDYATFHTRFPEIPPKPSSYLKTDLLFVYILKLTQKIHPINVYKI
jgi:hypothetical protein